MSEKIRIQVIAPKTATTRVEKDLVELSRFIYDNVLKEHPPLSFLTTGYEYGAEYENDVFFMSPMCICEKDDCELCNGTKPLFLHKKSGFGVTWYKWIGRETKYTRKLKKGEWKKIYNECLDSLM